MLTPLLPRLTYPSGDFTFSNIYHLKVLLGEPAEVIFMTTVQIS